MTTLANDPLLLLVIRAAFALLFASAAWHKLGDRLGFRGVLAAYRVLPDAAVPLAAFGIAALELAVALAWLVAPAATLAVAGTIALLGIYSLAIAVNLARGRRTIDCGCGVAGAAQPISEWLLVRNGLLAAAALFATRPVAPRPLVWVDALTLAGALMTLSCAWVAAHGLAAASARMPEGGAWINSRRRRLSEHRDASASRADGAEIK